MKSYLNFCLKDLLLYLHANLEQLLLELFKSKILRLKQSIIGLKFKGVKISKLKKSNVFLLIQEERTILQWNLEVDCQYSKSLISVFSANKTVNQTA